MKISKKIFLLFIIIGTFGASCKKNKSEEPEPNKPTDAPKGTFMFHLHSFIDNNEVDLYNITYTALDGRSMSLSMAQLYLSDIQLVKLDGSTVDVSGKKIFKVLETDTYLIGNVPVGNYKTFRFKVGLNATTNALNPTATADSTILNKPAMWFGGSAQPDGYVFMNVQGTIDTSSDMTGKMAPFVYKIGSNANYKQVTMPNRNFTIVENQVEYGHLYIDYYKMFTGIQLNQNSNLSVNTSAENSNALAAKIVNNIPTMFIYE